jgi:DNA-directed RNA polymerase specialized sigma subunit, sigma24 homolog
MTTLSKDGEYQLIRQSLKSDGGTKYALAIRIACGVALSVNHRAYVEDYYIRQMTMRDIAAARGVNVASVSRGITKAKEHCRRALEICEGVRML